MAVTATQEKVSSFLSKASLMKLRLKAIRAGVWFRALPRIDRVLVDLTIMVTSTVHSGILAKSLLAICRKLDGLVAGRFSSFFREVGFRLAQKLSLLAQQWGNICAKSWPFDANFVKFLAVMHANERKTYKT
jgi:hypothetical protein